MTASITMSQPLRSAVFVVKVRRCSVALRASVASFPFSTNLARDFSMPALPFWMISLDTSRTIVA